MSKERERSTGILVTLKGKQRHLRNARVVGAVRIAKVKGLNRHTQVEIHGLEIDGFSAHGERDSIDIPATE